MQSLFQSHRSTPVYFHHTTSKSHTTAIVRYRKRKISSSRLAQSLQEPSLFRLPVYPPFIRREARKPRCIISPDTPHGLSIQQISDEHRGGEPRVANKKRPQQLQRGRKRRLARQEGKARGSLFLERVRAVFGVCFARGPVKTAGTRVRYLGYRRCTEAVAPPRIQ